MTDDGVTRTGDSILDGLHPDLIAKVTRVLAVMARAAQPMRIVQGVRSASQQAALYAQGRTVKGPVVTNCDGIHTKSRHQVQADGFGHAVDCAFVDPEPFSDAHNWHLYGHAAKDEGLVWGGDWLTFQDRPHVELPFTMQELRS